MNDKERFEKIKEKVNSLLHLGDSEGNGEVNINAIYNDMSWLIEQVEKVEWLQQEQKRLKNQIYETVEEKFLLEKQLQQAQTKIERLEEWDAIRRDRIVQLEDQLEQVQDKVKKYEKALKEIAYDSFNDSKEDCQQIAKETLEGDFE
jgi:tetrahydrodipicolinate N-succinyltransferase